MLRLGTASNIKMCLLYGVPHLKERKLMLCFMEKSFIGINDRLKVELI